MLGERGDWENLRDKTLSLKKYALNSEEGKYFSDWIDRLIVNMD
jgi:hypothetical protein